MKGKKFRLLPLLICVALLFTLLPLSALAAGEIDRVVVVLDKPLANARPDYTASFPAGVSYYSAAYNEGNYRNDIRWFDVTVPGGSYTLDPETDRFQAGHVYTVDVYLSARSGYSFKSGLTALFNGSAPTETGMNDNTYFRVTYTFPAVPEPVAVSEVSVALDAPKANAKPDYTAELPSGAGYYSEAYNEGNYRNDIRWFDMTVSGSAYTLDPETDRFQAGHVYQVDVYLTAGPGYRFKSGMTALFNGSAPTETNLNDNNYFRVTYTFPAVPEPVAVSEVSVTLNAPIAGAKPDYTAELPSGAGYYSEAYNEGNYRNDIRWFDMTVSGSAYTLDPETDTFQAGHVYQVDVFLTAGPGYRFKSGLTALFNGSAPTETNLNEDNYFRVTYTFPAVPEPVAVSEVSVTLDAPTAGAKPDYTAELPSGAGYYSDAYNEGNYRNDIRWFDVTVSGSAYTLDPKTDVFQPGHVYKVDVYLTARPGYRFKSGLSALFNGSAPTETNLNEDNYFRVTYTFPAIKVQIPEVYVTLNAPEAGAAPDYTPEFPDDAPYYSTPYNSGKYRNDMLWYDVTDPEHTVTLDPDSAVFEEGRSYQVKVFLTAETNHVFQKYTYVELNGAQPEEVDVQTETYLNFTHTFPRLPGGGSAEDYVRRAYQVILGREGEEAGVANWVSELSGGASAGTIIAEFFRSKEYQDHGFSDAETVTRCYQAMLSREPSASEVALYVASLEDGYSTDKLVSSFVESPEFASICSDYGLTAGSITLGPRDQNGNITRFVERCYLYALERGADEGGLNEWCGHLIDHDLNPEGDVYNPERVAFGFIFSGESQKKARSDTQYIEMLYHMMLDREPDAGVSNWVEKLQSLTEAEVNWAIASGERTADEARDLARQKTYAEFAASEEFGLMLNNFGL